MANMKRAYLKFSFYLRWKSRNQLKTLIVHMASYHRCHIITSYPFKFVFLTIIASQVYHMEYMVQHALWCEGGFIEVRIINYRICHSFWKISRNYASRVLNVYIHNRKLDSWISWRNNGCQRWLKIMDRLVIYQFIQYYWILFNLSVHIVQLCCVYNKFGIFIVYLFITYRTWIRIM